MFSSVDLKYEINRSLNLIELDEEGNLIAADNKTITKYSEKGKKLYEFNTLEKGDISSIDVSNRHYILIFYKEFGEIVFLDETLSNLSNSISLNELEFMDVDMVCSSYNKGFWVFDNYNQSLYRIDRFMRRDVEVQDLNELTGTPLNIVKMKESSDYLVIMSDQNNLHIFDKLGGYITKFEEDGLKDFNIINSDLFYLSNEELKKYNLKSHQQSALLDSLGNIEKFSINSNSVALLMSDGVKCFSF